MKMHTLSLGSIPESSLSQSIDNSSTPLLQRKGRGRVRSQMNQEVEELIEMVIEDAYLSRGRLQVDEVYSLLALRLNEVNRHKQKQEKLLRPSKNTISRRIAIWLKHQKGMLSPVLNHTEDWFTVQPVVGRKKRFSTKQRNTQEAVE